MIDPAVWDKLASLEHDLEKTKLYVCGLIVAFLVAILCVAIVYYKVVDAQQDVNKAQIQISALAAENKMLKDEIAAKTTGEYITKTQWNYMKSRWNIVE